MLTSFSAVLVATLLTSPIPRQTSAKEVYERFASAFASAPALEVEIIASVTGREEPLTAAYRLGRPLYGSFRMELGSELYQAVGDGTKLVNMDGRRKEYFPATNGFQDLPLVGVLLPLRSFLAGSVVQPKTVAFAEPQPDHGLIHVLALEFETHSEELWITADGRALASVLHQSSPSGDLRYDIVYQRCVAWPDADPADFSASVPDDYQPAKDASASLLAAGTQAPNVTFTDVDGNRFDLESLRGKTVLLNFWFLLCEPCRRELPQLSSMWGEIQSRCGDDVVVLCVNKDDEGDAVLDYWIENDLLMTPVLQEAGAVDAAFGIRSWPTNYVIDPEGRVVYASGGWDGNAIRALLLGEG